VFADQAANSRVLRARPRFAAMKALPFAGAGTTPGEASTHGVERSVQSGETAECRRQFIEQ
jgi:hypothetical protein